MRVSDFIADFMVKQGVDLIFTITGAGNVRLIESACQAGIRYICPHHEQAGVMSALARLRVGGRPAVTIVTGGPGAVNTLSGVADAFLDSLPCIVIAGQEKAEFMNPGNMLRGKGVQGLDMVGVMGPVTKYAACVSRPSDVRRVMERAFHEAFSGRPGPVWVEIPQDVQWAQVDPEALEGFEASPRVEPVKVDMTAAANATLELLRQAQRPLLWVGHGIRLAKAEVSFRRLLNTLGVPSLVSWQAADLIPDDHPLYVGRAGTYGQRWANLALQNCDLLIALGTRLAIPQRGYNDAEFARAAKKVIVEIDPAELEKFRFHVDVPVLGNVADFLPALADASRENPAPAGRWGAWLDRCRTWRQRYPMAQEPRGDEAGINSYWFIDRLSEHLRRDDIVVTDMGTSLTCTHAAIRLKDGQRLLTSTGLGEMGYGLPGAIGAALAEPHRRVILIVGEGSLMMNLQELQTMQHHGLPIKIFMLNNSGYLTIKHTHHALYGSGGKATATAASTGVSFPNFSQLAPAFGIDYRRIDSPEGLDGWIEGALAAPGAVFAEMVMPEYQELIPKSAIKARPDGSLYSPPLEDLYPYLLREQLAREKLIPLIAEGDK
jgi:acetolactate synthase-1/2/3 large subunit